MGLFSKKKETGMREEAVRFVSNFHLERARDAVKKSDYKTAEKE